MRVKNSINTKVAVVPRSLERHIFQLSTCELTETEINAMQVSLFLLADYQRTKPFPAGAVCNVIYTTQDSIELLYLDNNQELLGNAPCLAVYFLQKIRQHEEYRWLDLIPIFLEELCHSLYQEKNEYRVKRLVCDIINQKYQMSLYKTYPDMFDENNQPKYCESLAADFASLS